MCVDQVACAGVVSFEPCKGKSEPHAWTIATGDDNAMAGYVEVNHATIIPVVVSPDLPA